MAGLGSRQDTSVNGYSNLNTANMMASQTMDARDPNKLGQNGSVDRVYQNHGSTIMNTNASPDQPLGKASQLDRSDVQHLSGSIDTNFIIKGQKKANAHHGHQQSAIVESGNQHTMHQQYLRHLKHSERQKQGLSHNNSMNIIQGYPGENKSGGMKYYANNASSNLMPDTSIYLHGSKHKKDTKTSKQHSMVSASGTGSQAQLKIMSSSFYQG